MRFQRLFSRNDLDVYAMAEFKTIESFDDGLWSGIEYPEGWSRISVEVVADAAMACAIPRSIKAIEENTVPSWLWRQKMAKEVADKETSLCHVFDRVAGAASYHGWKSKIFTSEDQARAFFDEIRFLLLQKILVLDPALLARLGIGWAYGLKLEADQARPTVKQDSLTISNATIDTVVSGRRNPIENKTWRRLLDARATNTALDLHFADTSEQWTPIGQKSATAAINLLALRHTDGSLNIEALRHTVRLAVFLLDLQSELFTSDLAIGHANLAPLLMALAIPYDSEAGRMTAAAISALMTAEAYAASAELAAHRGAGPEFAARREEQLRQLRNHRRAAYGERNDYEKLSIVPVPLTLEASADLSLPAAARSAWDRALDLVAKHGLRHLQVTGLADIPELNLLLESQSQGLMPLQSLRAPAEEGSGEQEAAMFTKEALSRLGYAPNVVERAVCHIAGTQSLAHAPGVSHSALRKAGFGKDELAKLEAYLPQTRDIRHAFTPWVLGEAFCRQILKIPAKSLATPGFDLLNFLGFSQDDIAAANLWCHGHDAVQTLRDLKPQHRTVFATASSVSPEALVRMAAAVACHLSGSAGLRLVLPLNLDPAYLEKLALEAWRCGLRSVQLVFSPTASIQPMPSAIASALRRKAARKVVASSFVHAQAPAQPKRQSRSAAFRPGRWASGKTKSRRATKTH